MLEIIMRRKQQIAIKQLSNNTRNGPNVRILTPLRTLQHNFRRPILPGANNRAMKLIILRSPPKINNPNLLTFGQKDLLSLFRKPLNF